MCLLGLGRVLESITKMSFSLHLLKKYSYCSAYINYTVYVIHLQHMDLHVYTLVIIFCHEQSSLGQLYVFTIGPGVIKEDFM